MKAKIESSYVFLQLSLYVLMFVFVFSFAYADNDDDSREHKTPAKSHKEMEEKIQEYKNQMLKMQEQMQQESKHFEAFKEPSKDMLEKVKAAPFFARPRQLEDIQFPEAKEIEEKTRKLKELMEQQTKESDPEKKRELNKKYKELLSEIKEDVENATRKILPIKPAPVTQPYNFKAAQGANPNYKKHLDSLPCLYVKKDGKLVPLNPNAPECKEETSATSSKSDEDKGKDEKHENEKEVILKKEHLKEILKELKSDAEEAKKIEKEAKEAFKKAAPKVILPHKKAKIVLPIEDEKVEIKEMLVDGDALKVKAKKKAKLFGLFSVELEIEAKLTPEGEVKEVDKPWWSIFAW